MDYDTYDCIDRYRVLYIGDLPEGFTIGYPKSEREFREGPEDERLKIYRVTDVEEAIWYLTDAIACDRWELVEPEKYGLVLERDEKNEEKKERFHMDKRYLRRLERCCHALEKRKESGKLEVEPLLNDALEMGRLCRTVRYQGWYQLERASEEAAYDITSKEELRTLMSVACGRTGKDGTIEILCSRLLSRKRSAQEEMAYLIYMTGIFSILREDTPETAELRMRNIFPSWLAEQYDSRLLKDREKRRKDMEEDFLVGCYWKKGKEGAFLGELVDRVYCELTDEELERLNDEVSDTTLVLAYQGMCGEARRRMLQNLSERRMEKIYGKAQDRLLVLDSEITREDAELLAALLKLIAKDVVKEPEGFLKGWTNEQMLFQTLREACDELDEDENRAEKGEKLLNDVVAILRLSDFSKREGLLTLEEELQKMNAMLTDECDLREMIAYIGNGAETDAFFELAWSLAATRRKRGAELIAHLIYMEGIHAIHCAEERETLELRMKALLPEDLEEDFQCLLEKEKERFH